MPFRAMEESIAPLLFQVAKGLERLLLRSYIHGQLVSVQDAIHAIKRGCLQVTGRAVLN